MQKIFWIGEKGFSDALKDCGWDVFTEPEETTLEYLQNSIEKDSEGSENVAIVGGSALRHLPLIRKLPCFTILYLSGPQPAQNEIAAISDFDACLVSGSDFLGAARESLPPERVLWLPPFAQESPESECSILEACPHFSAFPDQQENDFLQRVSHAILNLGNLPHSATHKPGVLLSTASQGEFDWRIPYAMAQGYCLLTPRVGNGLEKLFVDGEHYVGYAKGDVGDAVYRLAFLYEHPDLIEHIGQTAAAEIAQRHLVKHRAEAFTDFICDIFMNDQRTIIKTRLMRNKLRGI